MKKFLMLSMLICGAMSGAWGGTCTPMLCNEADHDVTEMLTTDGFTGGKNNNDDGRFTSKNCFMCDTGGDSECNYGDTVAIVDNWGNVKSAWQCTDTTGVDDEWLGFSMDTAATCGDSPLGNMDDNLQNAKNVQVREGDATRGTVSIVINNSRRVSTLCKYRECKDGYKASDDGQSCVKKDFGGGSTTQPVPDVEPQICLANGRKVGDTWAVDCKTLGITGGVKCGKRCNSDGSETGYVTQCQSNYRLDGEIWEGKYKKCVKVSGGGSEESALERCLASRTTEEGKACCYLLNSVATWDGQKCNCVIEGMEFKIENGRGQCVAKQTTPGEAFKCNATQLALLDGWLISCKDKPTIVSTINQIKDLCASQNVTTEYFNALWTVLMSLNPGECGAQPDLPPPPQVDELRVSIRIIRDAHSNLSGMAEGFKKSVWKDEEGKFNTSRLVSDSVAGVVLGTAGGLITSNVVKKNQVENGFEDLKCTIGGQVVADWGDQFRVGIQ